MLKTSKFDIDNILRMIILKYNIGEDTDEAINDKYDQIVHHYNETHPGSISVIDATTVTGDATASVAAPVAAPVIVKPSPTDAMGSKPPPPPAPVAAPVTVKPLLTNAMGSKPPPPPARVSTGAATAIVPTTLTTIDTKILADNPYLKKDRLASFKRMANIPRVNQTILRKLIEDSGEVIDTTAFIKEITAVSVPAKSKETAPTITAPTTTTSTAGMSLSQIKALQLQKAKDKERAEKAKLRKG